MLCYFFPLVLSPPGDPRPAFSWQRALPCPGTLAALIRREATLRRVYGLLHFPHCMLVSPLLVCLVLWLSVCLITSSSHRTIIHCHHDVTLINHSLRRLEHHRPTSMVTPPAVIALLLFAWVVVAHAATVPFYAGERHGGAAAMLVATTGPSLMAPGTAPPGTLGDNMTTVTADTAKGSPTSSSHQPKMTYWAVWTSLLLAMFLLAAFTAAFALRWYRQRHWRGNATWMLRRSLPAARRRGVAPVTVGSELHPSYLEDDEFPVIGVVLLSTTSAAAPPTAA